MADRVLIRGFVLGATLLLGCGGPSGGSVSLVLDIPNSMLDPTGYGSVEVVVHHPDGTDNEISVAVVGGEFDLGAIDVTPDVLLEATLRTPSGAAVGYGRAAVPVTLQDKARVVIPVRRPIIYFSGFVSEDPDPNVDGDRTWTNARPTYYDPSSDAVLDGSTQLMTTSLVTVSAGPRLFAIDQSAMSPSDSLVLTGAPTIREISTADHTVTSAPLATELDGAVADAAGTDDGRQLVVATSTHLFVVDTETGMTTPFADGDFARVAIVGSNDGPLTVIAIRNRSTMGACTAELVWATVTGGELTDVIALGTSGFTDVATDRGRAFYVDNCKGGELGEATASGVTMLRGSLGKPGTVAVSRGQAYVGIEKTTSVSLQQITIGSSDAPRILFDALQNQVLESVDIPGILRRLEPESLVFTQLEVGAGGDYVAWTLNAKYHGDAIPDAGIPQMDIETFELRVIDASTAAIIQNYRSVCEGTIIPTPFNGDLVDWICALSPGQIEATRLEYDHRIHSMAFQFGKK